MRLAPGPDVAAARPLAVLGLAGASAGVAFALTANLGLALAGLLALVAVVIAFSRMLAGVAILAASFYFENYLTRGTGFLTGAKLIGLLAMAAWLFEWGSRGRPVVGSPQLWVAGGLALWIVPSMALAYDQTRATVVATRYAMFLALYFLVLQAVAGQRRRAEALADVVLVAAAISATLALAAFFAGEVDRARGPLDDPNDFGFLLASTVPLALHRLKHARSALHQVVVALAVAVTGAGILATFSRSAVLGLAVAGVWGLATRRLPVRVAVVALAVLACMAILAYRLQPDVVESALERKQNIAGRNVSSRLVTWEVALREFSTSPVFGVGPGNYESRFSEFELPDPRAEGPPSTHNAYLNVLAELGIPGLALFIAFLALSWRTLRRRHADPVTDGFQGAVAAGFVVVLVGALFLTEQFYPPLWFLAALGSLDRDRESVGAERG